MSARFVTCAVEGCERFPERSKQPTAQICWSQRRSAGQGHICKESRCNSKLGTALRYAAATPASHSLGVGEWLGDTCTMQRRCAGHRRTKLFELRSSASALNTQPLNLGSRTTSRRLSRSPFTSKSKPCLDTTTMSNEWPGTCKKMPQSNYFTYFWGPAKFAGL